MTEVVKQVQVLSTSQKLRRYAKKASKTYSKTGIKGLCGIAIKKLSDTSLSVVYRNSFLRSMHHPKLKTAFLELTNKCNLRCKMCNWQSRKETGYISRELFESCVDQFSEMKLEVLNLEFAGESLLHPDFADFLKFAIQKRDQGGIGSVGLTDNGMLFNQSIANLFISLQVDWVNFSLDGIGQINDSIRLGSKYSVIEKNIKYLIEARGSAKRPVVLLNMVDTGKTEDEKLEFYREWINLVDGIELLPSILPDNTWENRDSPSQNIRIAPPPAFCHYPLDTIIICWDGKVTGCCFDTNIDMALGDASKESIKQIWGGLKFQQLRKAVLTKTFPLDSPCYKCEFWKVNFEPRDEPILDGKARIEYGGTIRKIRSALQKEHE
jgi:MoaA/NifB/PqqE/SkfB family radical SAM enzyme